MCRVVVMTPPAHVWRSEDSSVWLASFIYLYMGSGPGIQVAMFMQQVLYKLNHLPGLRVSHPHFLVSGYSQHPQPRLELKTYGTTLAFYMGARDLNSGHHTFTVQSSWHSIVRFMGRDEF